MKRMGILIPFAVVVGIAAFLYARRTPDAVKSETPKTEAVPEKAASNPDVRAEKQSQPQEEVAKEDPVPDPARTEPQGRRNSQEKQSAAPGARYGNVAPVKGAASGQAASVLAALKSGHDPERLSVLHPPAKPFDFPAFKENPAAYLGVCEPGRVFVTMEPGKEVPALRAVGPTHFRLAPGEEAVLRAQGAPGSPVSFTALDLGTFKESGLSSATVMAGNEGVATVTFLASGGATSRINVLAGSPMASGQASYKVDIEAR